jgi:hypothetical protein
MSQGTKGDNAVWLETPEQKRRRLENEVMGIESPATSRDKSGVSTTSKAEKEAAEKRIREYNVSWEPSRLSCVLNLRDSCLTRKNPGARRSMKNTRKSTRRRRMTQAPDHLTARKISLEE